MEEGPSNNHGFSMLTTNSAENYLPIDDQQSYYGNSFLNPLNNLKEYKIADVDREAV